VQYPAFGAVLLPLDPIIRLYYSFPLASLIVFFGIYLVGRTYVITGCRLADVKFPLLLLGLHMGTVHAAMPCIRAGTHTSTTYRPCLYFPA
jgi:hypothetical protein